MLILLIAVGSAGYAATQAPERAFTRQGEARAAEGLTYSGLAALAPVATEGSVTLPAQPLTSSSALRLPEVSSSRLASDASLRLSASRSVGDQQDAPLPPASPAPEDPQCDRTISTLFCVYAVQPGDTLSKIAAQFGLKGTEAVPAWELVVQSNRPDIVSADDYIQPGQQLRVPLKNGIVHLVLTGETLSELAADYGVTTAAIVEAGNNVGAGGALGIGQELLIPNPSRVPPTALASAAAPTPTPEPSSTPAPTSTPVANQPTAVPSASRTATATRTPTPRGTPGASSRAGFIWPVTGPISSYFGPSHPLGIDIDLYADPNAPIAAAAGGIVTFAGGNACCSYGLYVMIDHGNGYSTLYAHLSGLAVSQSQRVSQGQQIGRGGRTGYATGNHLHFEVRFNDKVIDPLTVLP